MSRSDEGDGGPGRPPKLTQQDVLKALDASDAPFMSASELAAKLGVDRSTANRKLKQMREEDLVEKKEIGARAVGWWALKGPRLSAESAERVEQSRRDIEQGDTVPLEDL